MTAGQEAVVKSIRASNAERWDTIERAGYNPLYPYTFNDLFGNDWITKDILIAAIGSISFEPTVIPYTTDSSVNQFIAVPEGFTRNADIFYRYKVGDNWQREAVFAPLEVFSGSTFTGWNVTLSNSNDGVVISSDGEVVVRV